MPNVVANIDGDMPARALTAREQFTASGTNVSEWARERGFSLTLVHQVLSGRRRCIRGESHRIAVALGIKVEATAPGAPPIKTGDRAGGHRA
ncbi:DNA-binding protein [Sphingomonas sp. SAFR-052]|uniref:DNA-binding protein n=1 Tax=Sphingomonas sp. SAFR-052 TaxID=3436867 RepID=UPI003F7FCF37